MFWLRWKGYTAYLMETHTHLTVSVMAGDTLARSLGSVAGPLFTDLVFEIIEIGWGNTLIGRVATILSFLPFGFRRYGQQIQDPSKYVVKEPGKGSLKPKISSTVLRALPASPIYAVIPPRPRPKTETESGPATAVELANRWNPAVLEAIKTTPA
ncbi:hypothetical protein DER46DRAFT_581738 [Fusarium sp. MPI-SDFR-AT-0072]|nr:hypothetical protein DER46DRAFT_581738 [Fusarium sp. MPI-SDFR-AT-0072]